jgi:hypothetical protein
MKKIFKKILNWFLEAFVWVYTLQDRLAQKNANTIWEAAKERQKLLNLTDEETKALAIKWAKSYPNID